MNKPYFLWDYDLSEKDVKRILREGDDFEKRWLIARILESAHFRDVWKYLSLNEVREIFPRLKLKKPIKKAWQRAFKAWDG